MQEHKSACAESLPGSAGEQHEYVHGSALKGGTPHDNRRTRILTVRSHSGLSGDMLVTGLLRMNAISQSELNDLLEGIFPKLSGTVRLVTRDVAHITGWHIDVDLPCEHVHRSCQDIFTILQESSLSPGAVELTQKAFLLLAETEGAVHGIAPEAVHFHEVGALDSILDISLACELFVRLAPDLFVVSPLPVCDGSVSCAHGILPVPAPAVLKLLSGLMVRPFPGSGETVTPTAAALLHVFQPTFGPWPEMLVEKTDLVYGTKVFPNLPNGASFAFGFGSSQLLYGR